MTAKAKKQGVSVIKRTVTGAAIGIAAALTASLITAGVAVKTGDPLSIASTLAAVCVLCGAISAALFGSVSGKSFLHGIYSGGLYTVLLVILSLCMPSSEGSPLVLTGAAIFGVLGGCAMRPKGGKKKLKKYVKR